MITPNRHIQINALQKSISSIQENSQKLNTVVKNIGWLRLAVFISGIIIFFSFYLASLRTVAILSTLVLLIIFLIISNQQSKLISRTAYVKQWLALKQSFLSRAAIDWKRINLTSAAEEMNRDLETDLDLSGERSLLQLLDLCKSVTGKEYLRSLLSVLPSDAREIWNRQSIVKELFSMSHFRNKFLLITHLSNKKEFDSEILLSWLRSGTKLDLVRKKYHLFSVLSVLNLLLISYCLLLNYSSLWIYSTSIYLLFYFLNQRYIKSCAADAEQLKDEFKKIIAPIEFVNGYSFNKKSKLGKLCAPIKTEDNPTSQLKRISLILELLAFRANPYLWFAAIIIWPVDYLLAMIVEQSKQKIEKHLPDWLDTLHQLEAYNSLASFASLNPEYNFPQIVESTKNQIEIQAEEIGHPLIEHAKRVRNDFILSGTGTIRIITGSNMSGKSTFLRTIGINICLAYAGAPIDAKIFKVSFCRLFTCIKVNDSVIDGISYFYAEVKRLRKLLDILEEESDIPVLFLIDEIFKGTNNLERHAGSSALIKLLLNKKGSGLVSTHDLELVKLAEGSEKIKNFHFREEIADGKMIFDYKLRPGPCPTTNALKIMQINGLPIQ